MSNRRQLRVEELLRRELAEMLIRGDIKDPRIEPSSAISITGVRVTGDLGEAVIFIDIYSQRLDHTRVLRAFRSASAAIRSMLGKKVQLKRVPELRFEYDSSIERGARVAEILQEIANDPEPVPGVSESQPDGAET